MAEDDGKVIEDETTEKCLIARLAGHVQPHTLWYVHYAYLEAIDTNTFH